MSKKMVEKKKLLLLWWQYFTSARERNFVFSNENNFTEYLFYSLSHINWDHFVFGMKYLLNPALHAKMIVLY